MKKQFAVFSFIFLFALSPLASFAHNEGGILIDYVIQFQVKPIAHLDAQYVTIKILDANGNMLTGGQVTPGDVMTFTKSGNERKALEIYHMASGAEFIIVSEIMP